MKTRKLKVLFVGLMMFLLCKVGISQTTQVPQFNSTEEKEAWIKAHPKEYQQMLDEAAKNATIATTSNPAATSTTATSTATTTTTTTNPVDSTFPQYVNTGNKEKDDADYAAAKEAWIKANPDKYKVMTAQPK